MWLEKLDNIYQKQINFGPLGYLNLRNDLHLAIYVIESLKDIISFKSANNKFIIKDKGGKNFTESNFMYWWHVTRIKDIFEEETTIINSFESVKKKIIKLQKTAPIIEDNDNDKDKETKQEKINEINEKITKLNNYLKKESPKVKQNLNLLSNYRNIANNKELFQKLVDSIKVCVQNQ